MKALLFNPLSKIKSNYPGTNLLLHDISHTTIGHGLLNCRVRDGNGCDQTC